MTTLEQPVGTTPTAGHAPAGASDRRSSALVLWYLGSGILLLGGLLLTTLGYSFTGSTVLALQGIPLLGLGLVLVAAPSIFARR